MMRMARRGRKQNAKMLVANRPDSFFFFFLVALRFLCWSWNDTTMLGNWSLESRQEQKVIVESVIRSPSWC